MNKAQKEVIERWTEYSNLVYRRDSLIQFINEFNAVNPTPDPVAGEVWFRPEDKDHVPYIRVYNGKDYDYYSVDNVGTNNWISDMYKVNSFHLENMPDDGWIKC